MRRDEIRRVYVPMWYAGKHNRKALDALVGKGEVVIMAKKSFFADMMDEVVPAANDVRVAMRDYHYAHDVVALTGDPIHTALVVAEAFRRAPYYPDIPTFVTVAKYDRKFGEYYLAALPVLPIKLMVENRPYAPDDALMGSAR